MSDKVNVDIGSYSLKQFSIVDSDNNTRRIDISYLITEWGLNENIADNVLMGYAIIADSLGVIEEFPLRGQEFVIVEYEDLFGNVLRHEFFLYRVSDIVRNKHSTVSYYSIFFSSIEVLLSNNNRIRQTYKGQIHNMIGNVCTEYFDVSNISFDAIQKKRNFEETNGNQVYVIPSLSPLQAINFMTRKAFAKGSDRSSLFRFFETRNNTINFKSVGALFDEKRSDAIVYNYDPAINIDVDGTMKHYNNLTDFSIVEKVDTFATHNLGGFASRGIEYDFLNKEIKTRNYVFADDYENFSHADENAKFPYSEEFTNNYLRNPSHDIKSIKDFSRNFSESVDRKYGEILQKKSARAGMLGHVKCVASVVGRNDIFAGDVVRLNIVEADAINNKKTHRTLSGYYLVSGINHTFGVKNHEMTLHLMKDGYKGEN